MELDPNLRLKLPARAQAPYLGVIWQLARAAAGHPMLLLEVPHVSLRLQARASAVDDVAMAAVAAVRAEGFADACFVAHSYGTFCVSRVRALAPSLVHSMVRARPGSQGVGQDFVHAWASA